MNTPDIPLPVSASPGDSADFDRALAHHMQQLSEVGVNLPAPKVRIRLGGGARAWLERTLRHFVPGLVWLEEYGQVADWLADNRGQGLLLMGPCGRGKTEIAMHALPCVVHMAYNLVLNTFTAYEMSRDPGAVMRSKLAVVDDVGIEAAERVDYGTRTCPFAEVVDHAEKRGNLLVLTTNLSASMFTARYGDRVTDRLRSLVRVVRFGEGSLRGRR